MSPSGSGKEMGRSSRTYVQCVAFLELSHGPQAIEGRPYRPCTNVLMLKPRVGLTPAISSPLSFFSIVVFPALSRPLLQVHCIRTLTLTIAYRNKSLISFSFSRFFRIIVSSPIRKYSGLERAEERSGQHGQIRSPLDRMSESDSQF